MTFSPMPCLIYGTSSKGLPGGDLGLHPGFPCFRSLSFLDNRVFPPANNVFFCASTTPLFDPLPNFSFLRTLSSASGSSPFFFWLNAFLFSLFAICESSELAVFIQLVFGVLFPHLWPGVTSPPSLRARLSFIVSPFLFSSPPPPDVVSPGPFRHNFVPASNDAQSSPFPCHR